MAHPMKGDVERLGAAKYQLIVGGSGKLESPWAKAERISGSPGASPPPNPPNMAVPQFENDRSLRDVPYGSETTTPPVDKAS